MPLTSSTITQNVLRPDGSRRITEMHIDHLGGKHPVSYPLSVGDDSTVLLADHASRVLATLARAELHEIRNRVVEGVDVRTIKQEFTRLADLKAIFIEYLAEADAEKTEATIRQSRIDTAKTVIG